MQGNTLSKVSEVKYLGVMINEKLNWNTQIEHIKNKISKAYFILTKIRHYVNRPTLMLLYNSLIYTHLNYCVCTWGGAPPTTLKPLLTIQKKTTRIITFSDYNAHSNPLFYTLKMLQLNDIYKLKIAIMFRKLHKNNNLQKSTNLISIDQIHAHNTRLSASKNYYPNTSKSKLGQSTPTANGVKIWRDIPHDIKKLPLYKFKNALKRNLIDQYKDT